MPAPDALAGLRLWLKADLADFTGGGGSWANRGAAGGQFEASGVARPTWVPDAGDGLPAVHFGGDPVVMTGPGWTSLMDATWGERTIIALVRVFDAPPHPQGYNDPAILGDVGGWLGLLARGVDASTYQLRHYNWDTAADFAAVDAPFGEWVVAHGDHDNATLRVSVDGAAPVGVASGATGGGDTSGLGRAAGYFVGMDLRELLVFDRVLSDTERAEMIAYLAEWSTPPEPPPPPPAPTWTITPDTLSLAASRLYEQWQHLEVDGEAEGWPWAVLAAACAAPIDDLYDLLSGGPTPWAPAFDPELAAEVLQPEFATALLEWTGQFVGVRQRSELPALGQRLRLMETRSAVRGSPAAIVGAARQRAVGPDGTPGSATVILVERIGGDPYHFAVTMYVSEVPDPAGTIRDIEAETPAGRRGVDPDDRFDFNLVTGGDFATLSGAFATFADVTAAFGTFDELTANPLGI